MRSKMVVLGLLAVALGVTACGSSSSSSSAGASTSTPTSHREGKASGVPSRRYTVKLTGPAETPPGAPHGAGVAIVAIHGSSLHVCWRFAHLRGFTSPTFAHIHMGPAGKAGNIAVPLSTGSKLKHKACVSAAKGVIKAIEKNPSGYYVNIHSKQYPSGAVRAQL